MEKLISYVFKDISEDDLLYDYEDVTDLDYEKGLLSTLIFISVVENSTYMLKALSK